MTSLFRVTSCFAKGAKYQLAQCDTSSLINIVLQALLSSFQTGPFSRANLSSSLSMFSTTLPPTLEDRVAMKPLLELYGIARFSGCVKLAVLKTQTNSPQGRGERVAFTSATNTGPWGRPRNKNSLSGRSPKARDLALSHLVS